MELILCILILKVETRISQYIWDLVGLILKNYANIEGFIGKVDSLDENEDVFQSVYHASLVAMIASNFLKSDASFNQEYSGNVPIDVLYQILQGYGLNTSEEFYYSLENNEENALKKLEDLKGYYLLFVIMYLEQLYFEKLESARFTLKLLRRLERANELLEERYRYVKAYLKHKTGGML